MGGFSRGLDICRFVFSVDVLVCKGCLYIGGFVGIFTQAVWSFVYVCNFSWVDTGIGIWLAMFTGGCLCILYFRPTSLHSEALLFSYYLRTLNMPLIALKDSFHLRPKCSFLLCVYSRKRRLRRFPSGSVI